MTSETVGGAVVAVAAGRACDDSTVLHDGVRCASGPSGGGRYCEPDCDECFFHDESLTKPQPHAVDDSNGEHECPGDEKAPQAFAEACEDVVEPRDDTNDSNDPAHGVPLSDV